MRRLIALDIDGVLATTKQFYSSKRHEEWNCYSFDPKCVKVFNEILEKTDYPDIVLSSDWRTHYDLETMNKIFEWNKVNTKIKDFTPDVWGVKFNSVQELDECRAFEINYYVGRQEVKFGIVYDKWIAIDDLFLHPHMNEENFVHTPRISEGIKQSGVKDKILKKLL